MPLEIARGAVYTQASRPAGPPTMRPLLVAALFFLPPAARADENFDGPVSDILSEASRRFNAKFTSDPEERAAARAVRFRYDLDGLARHARRNHVPLDWSALLGGSARVIVIGELHPLRGIKDELSLHAAEIKSSGITHLALEMFGDDRQGLLGRYAAGAAPEAEVLAALKDWGWPSEPYMALLRAARSSGLGLVALDMPRADQREMLRILCRTEPDALYTDCAEDKQTLARDYRMASNLSRVLDIPGARVLALVGRDHAQLGRAPTLKLGEYGHAPVSYFVLEDRKGERDALNEAVAAAGLAGRRIFVPLPRDATGYDGFISLPEAPAAR